MQYGQAGLANPNMLASYKPDEDRGAFDRLVQTDARLRETVERAACRLNNLIPPTPQQIQCSPPDAPRQPDPMRSPLGQIVYEINLVIDRLDGIISRVDL